MSHWSKLVIFLRWEQSVIRKIRELYALFSRQNHYSNINVKREILNYITPYFDWSPNKVKILQIEKYCQSCIVHKGIFESFPHPQKIPGTPDFKNSQSPRWKSPDLKRSSIPGIKILDKIPRHKNIGAKKPQSLSWKFCEFEIRPLPPSGTFCNFFDRSAILLDIWQNKISSQKFIDEHKWKWYFPQLALASG